MAKPVNENLKDVRVENEQGDLIPLLDQIKEATGFLILHGEA